jgi:WD40 repeat protein
MIASAGDDKKIMLWDALKGKKIKEIDGHEGSIRALSWHPGNAQLASASFDKTVRVWFVPTGKHLYSLPTGKAGFYSVDWDLNGARLATASADGSAAIWEIIPKKVSMPFTIDQVLFLGQAVEAYCNQKELKVDDHLASVFKTLSKNYRELVTEKLGVKIAPSAYREKR